ncbi:hypothetical protein Ahy_B05g077782 [Arachis hypogaea]|uniref:Aminotransferase-like plant mobile domain-containing protein n=1 Tax=Arachis hypogaea TaxID=3818 RepID=A0A444Z5G0_ARAHY|nr:hypothetical protein Ahy_B05g077782 [Arachis hypogaea]
MAIFGSEPTISSSSKYYIKLCHIFCLLGTILFANKSTTYAHAKYLPLVYNFEQIHTYSWGQQLLCTFIGKCAMHHDITVRKWMALLIYCLFGRESKCHVLHPQQLAPAEISVSWSSSFNMCFNVESLPMKQSLDIKEHSFDWRPYERLVTSANLHGHLEVCVIMA